MNRGGEGHGAGAPRVQAQSAPARPPQEQQAHVQHRLRALGPLVWELLDGRGARFYLAG